MVEGGQGRGGGGGGGGVHVHGGETTSRWAFGYIGAREHRAEHCWFGFAGTWLRWLVCISYGYAHKKIGRDAGGTWKNIGRQR